MYTPTVTMANHQSIQPTNSQPTNQCCCQVYTTIFPVWVYCHLPALLLVTPTPLSHDPVEISCSKEAFLFQPPSSILH